MAVDKNSQNSSDNNSAPHDGARQEDRTTNHEQQQAHSRNRGQQGNPNQRTNSGGLFGGASVRGMGRPMSRSGAGQVAQDYYAAFKEILDTRVSAELKPYFRMSIMDQQTHNVALSGILVVMVLQDQGKTYVSVYTLLLERSAPELPTRNYETWVGNQRQTIAVPVVAGQLFGDELFKRIESVLASEGIPLNENTEILDAGGTPVHRELSLENDRANQELMFEATNACFSLIRETLGYAKDDNTLFTVQTHIPNSDKVVATLDINPSKGEVTQTLTGLPVRDDIHIKLVAESAGDSVAFNNVDNLTQSTSFVDLLFEPNPAYNANPWLGQQANANQLPGKYLPRLVITDIQSQIDASSMELFLLGLSTQGLALKDGNYARVFTNRSNIPANEDMHDIGAIGYEVYKMDQSNNPLDYGMKIDTKENGFDDRMMMQFLQTFLETQHLIVSLDIDEAGPMAWITMAFDAAARGDSGAYDNIYYAADNLSNGEFSKLFQYGEPIVRPANTKIHLGYYTDRQGRRRDLREVDTLAILNAVGSRGQEGIQIMADWENTFTDTTTDEILRLHKRLDIIKGIVGDNVVVKGYATRVDLSPQFIWALAQSITKAGLQISQQNMQVHMGAQAQRGYGDYQRWVAGADTMSGLFTNATSRGYNGPGFQPQQNTSRWGR